MVRLLLVCLCLGQFSFLPAAAAEAETAADTSNVTFRIALLATGSITDGGWNQLAKDGLTVDVEGMNVQLTVLQKVAQDRAAGHMQQLAAKGIPLIIAHGYEYLNPASEVAAHAPNTRIVVCGADVARPNIITIDFDVSGASYQAGVLAARVSTKKTFGYIGGAQIPSVKACYRGFLAGVRSVLPQATVSETYTSWDQPQQNKAQAEALLRQGIDVIYHNVDAASSGIFEAIAAANAQGGPGSAWVIGCVADQNDRPLVKDAILGSAVIRLDATFASIIKDVQAGTSKPGLVVENLARGTCVFVPNPRLLKTTITPEMCAELDAVGAKIIAGTVKIPTE